MAHPNPSKISFHLSWPQIVATLHEFRKMNFLCDVVLLSRSETFLAHAVLLAAVSPYFKLLLESHQPAGTYYLNLQDVDDIVIEMMLDFIYTGKFPQAKKFDLSVDMSHILSLLKEFGLDVRCSNETNSQMNSFDGRKSDGASVATPELHDDATSVKIEDIEGCALDSISERVNGQNDLEIDEKDIIQIDEDNEMSADDQLEISNSYEIPPKEDNIQDYTTNSINSSCREEKKNMLFKIEDLFMNRTNFQNEGKCRRRIKKTGKVDVGSVERFKKLFQSEDEMSRRKTEEAINAVEKGASIKKTREKKTKSDVGIEKTSKAKDDIRKPMVCKICNKSFKLGTTSLARHMRIHTGQKKYSCQFCDMKFLYWEPMKCHEARHRGEDRGSCPIDGCGKTFAHRGNLLRHLRLHSVSKPFLCDYCGMAFTQKTSLDAHIVDHTHESKSHLCTVCGDSFVSNTRLVYHVKTKHLEPGVSKFVCKICSKSFVQKSYYLDHVESHSGTKRHACPYCQKSFCLKVSLNQHVRTHNFLKPGPRPEDCHYVCQECGDSFAQKVMLQRHTKKHNPTYHSCPICGKSFKNIPMQLAVHMRIHTGEKPFNCALCNQSFRQRPHLTRHLLCHTGEKPNACDKCSAAYKNKYDLQLHYRRVHKTELPQDYKPSTSGGKLVLDQDR